MIKTSFKILLGSSLFLMSNLLAAQIIIEKDVKETNYKNEGTSFKMIMEAYGSGNEASDKYVETGSLGSTPEPPPNTAIHLTPL